MDNSDVRHESQSPPFLTRFFEEVMRNAEVPYRSFDFSKVDTNKEIYEGSEGEIP